jgi:Exostosin family
MKIYFVCPTDTLLADQNTGLVNRLKSSIKNISGITILDSPDDADAIIINETNSYKEWRYIDKLLLDKLIAPNLHKTYTINTDDCATGLLRGLYTSLPKERFNEAIHAIVPYTYYPNEFVTKDIVPERGTLKYLASWRGNTKSNPKLRCNIINLLANKPEFIAESTNSWLNHTIEEKETYVKLILSSKFSLCPGGWAPISFRIYESMALGVAPVIIADRCLLPDGPNWDKCSIRIKERDLNSLPEILEERAETYIELGSAAREEWLKHFSLNAIDNYYTDCLLQCLHKSIGNSLLKNEVKRMRSFHMYSSNNWTIPQRIFNKFNRILMR